MGNQIIWALSMISVATGVHVVARPRPGRFLLVRVLDAERHRAASRRVIIFNALAACAGLAVLLLSNEQDLQLAAVFAASLLPALWMLLELGVGLRSAAPLPAVPTRYRVPLEAPPAFFSYLSPPLELLNAAALILPPLLLLTVWDTLGPWFFFLPMMLFITALLLFCAWMQARERWVLPTEGGERYAELQHEKRARMIRLLEVGMVTWNAATGMIWMCIAIGSAGPAFLGAIIPVGLGGLGFIIALAVQLPRLTRIADELATLAQTDALGTRREGWRWAGLIYYAPGDPALFVPKRSGLGQTLNFARPTAWLFLAGVVLMPLSITLLAIAARS